MSPLKGAKIDYSATMVIPKLQPRLQVGVVGALRGFMRMIHL